MIQANINNRWAQLSQGEKAELLGIYTRAGYNDLASIIADYNEFSSGGGIHIKPENRGKFTALKKRTGHSASWFKEHGTPAQKKMAVFALNARKWNHADGGPLGEENEIQVNHIPNWTVFGTDYSTWKPSDIQNIIDWGYTDPESFFGEEGESTRNALSRAGMADSVIGDIYANMDPELQSKFGDRYKGTKQRQQEYTGGITNAIDSAGQRIYQIADTVAGFVPGPVGMIDWLGHMGADVAEGEFGKVGKDLALAAGLGFGARALGKGIRYLKGYWDEIGNFGEDTFRAFTDRVPGKVSTNFVYDMQAARDAAEEAELAREFRMDQLGVDVPIRPNGGTQGTSFEPGFWSNKALGLMAKQGNAEAAAELASRPYEIENLGGGYMLKSLMRGNPLEKQISKSGTVNVNNVRAIAGKGSKVEQAVIDKVLASDEFAGKKSIDYNRFRKAIQDELITYNRTPDTRWNNYGIDRLGIGSYMDAAESPEMRNKFNEFIMNNFSWDPVSDSYYIPGDPSSKSFDTNDLAEMFFEEGPGFLDIPVGVTKKLDTFTFSSSRIPNGSAKHYDVNTLGHSRTYTTVDEPDVLHVMESQSDWGQGYKKMNLDGEYNQKRINSLERRINNLKESINSEMEGLRTEKMNDGSDMSPWFADGLRKQIEKDKQLLEELTVELDMRRNPKSATQQDYLAENFTSRQIQENLRYAAEKGQKKMRYPTRETAAKIEGYPEREAYFDASGNDVTNSKEPLTELPKEWKEKYDNIENRIRSLTEKDEEYGSIAFKRHENDKTTWITQNTYADVIDLATQQREILENHSQLKPGITKKTIYDYEDILRKYTEFPKQYQKLYKGANVRTVTDSKGNTWYEVDVPEGYLQQEWAYKNGGKLQQYADFSGFF